MGRRVSSDDDTVTYENTVQFDSYNRQIGCEKIVKIVTDKIGGHDANTHHKFEMIVRLKFIGSSDLRSKAQAININ